jgi:hypothetical protein
MRKTIVVLVGLTLLLMAGQADAVNNGTGDPLGLISAAVIQPFWSLNPDNTLIEVTSPLDFNFLHVVYFDASCNRLISRPKEVSFKGAIVFSPDADLAANVGLGGITGLAVISNGGPITATPIPDFDAIHVRGIWFNFTSDFIRYVDPIAVRSPDTPAPQQTYSALRSAASFGAPVDVPPTFTTFLYLICPGPLVLGEIPPPAFPTPPLIAYAPSGFGFIRGVLYDDDEDVVIDFSLPCNCSSMFELSVNISPVYGDVFRFLPELVNYTELFTYNAAGLATPPPVASNPLTFTGYRGITVNAGLWPGGSGDSFGRLANGSAYNYRANGNDDELFGPFFFPGLR